MKATRHHHLKLFQNHREFFQFLPSQYQKVATGLKSDSSLSLILAVPRWTTPTSSSLSPCRSDANQLASNHFQMPHPQSSTAHLPPDTPESSANHHPFRLPIHIASRTVCHHITDCSRQTVQALSPHSTNCIQRFVHQPAAPNQTIG